MPKERYKEGTGDTTGLRFRKIPSRFPQDSLRIPSRFREIRATEGSKTKRRQWLGHTSQVGAQRAKNERERTTNARENEIVSTRGPPAQKTAPEEALAPKSTVCTYTD